MKKRVIALFLAATMVLGLTACGGGDNTNAPAADNTQTADNTATDGATADTQTTDTQTTDTNTDAAADTTAAGGVKFFPFR